MQGRLRKAVILGLLLSGCATQRPEPPEETVARKALERWQALIAGDFAKAYSYYAPGYRKTVDLKSFALQKAKGVGVWLAARVEKVACPEKDRCTARVWVKTRFFHPRVGKLETESPVEERWIYRSGKWWYVPP